MFILGGQNMDKNTIKTMFSSNKSEWETPQDLFDMLNNEYNFNLDACALAENAKCDTYYTPEIDGLTQEWRGNVWMNPPYGRNINKWIEKAYDESLRGSTVVALIPVRTDTRYWHDYVMNSNEVRLIKGRLKFSNSENSAPFPSAIVEFSNHNKLYPDFIPLDLNNIIKHNIKQKPFYTYEKISPIRFVL